MALTEVNWDEFEFRCHYIGELMTGTKGKSNAEKLNEAQSQYDSAFNKLESIKNKDSKTANNLITKLYDLEDKMKVLRPIKDIPSLSDTAKVRLAQIYTEQTTGRKKDIKSIYLEKGLKTEEDSITTYSLRTGKMYRKNKERLSNGFVNGEIDFDDEEEDTIIDTKSSFDLFTFDATVARRINPLYDWQMQAYMWLKNRSKARLAYCLNNTPSELRERMKKQLLYSFVGTDEDYKEACQMIDFNHTYDDLPLERKIRIYEIKRDDEKIALLQSYIPHFRNYLKNIKNSKIQEDDFED